VVPDAGDHLGFDEEPGMCDGVGKLPAEDHLDRDRAVEFALLGLEHDTHAAAPEFPFNFVARDRRHERDIGERVAPVRILQEGGRLDLDFGTEGNGRSALVLRRRGGVWRLRGRRGGGRRGLVLRVGLGTAARGGRV
jgi:hypothetical protein